MSAEYDGLLQVALEQAQRAAQAVDKANVLAPAIDSIIVLGCLRDAYRVVDTLKRLMEARETDGRTSIEKIKLA
mgnify:CR=1 FL=1